MRCVEVTREDRRCAKQKLLHLYVIEMSPKRELERAVFWDRDLNKEKLIKPDNYVDEELFLKLLVVNPGFKKVSI